MKNSPDITLSSSVCPWPVRTEQSKQGFLHFSCSLPENKGLEQSGYGYMDSKGKDGVSRDKESMLGLVHLGFFTSTLHLFLAFVHVD